MVAVPLEVIISFQRGPFLFLHSYNLGDVLFSQHCELPMGLADGLHSLGLGPP